MGVCRLARSGCIEDTCGPRLWIGSASRAKAGEPLLLGESFEHGRDPLAGELNTLRRGSGVGLDGHHEHSFREIAGLMGVKWQAVQRIHHRAMEALRRRHAGFGVVGYGL